MTTKDKNYDIGQLIEDVGIDNVIVVDSIGYVLRPHTRRYKPEERHKIEFSGELDTFYYQSDFNSLWESGKVTVFVNTDTISNYQSPTEYLSEDLLNILKYGWFLKDDSYHYAYGDVKLTRDGHKWTVTSDSNETLKVTDTDPLLCLTKAFLELKDYSCVIDHYQFGPIIKNDSLIKIPKGVFELMKPLMHKKDDYWC